MHRSTQRLPVVSLALFTILMLTGAGRTQVAAQTQGVTILINRSYTTTARIFPNPSALSPVLRNEHTLVEGLTGFSAEVQLPVPHSEFAIGLSIEYLSSIEEGDRPIALGGVLRTLPVKDGFTLIPIELRGIIAIPIQSETIRMTMAGGGGAYIAGKVLNVAGVGVRSTSTTVGYGIHVSLAFEYKLIPGVWLHAETRFRDPDVTLEYAYERSSTEYNGVLLPFPTAPMQTRINVDGMSFAGGIMVDLPDLFGR